MKLAQSNYIFSHAGLIISFFFLSSCTGFQGIKTLHSPITQGLKPVRPLPPKEFSLDWPIDKAKLTQKFNLTSGRPHWGIDLAGQRGTSIFAAHPGLVTYVGQGFTGYGKLVIIEFNDNWATFYSHLQSIFVKQGQLVEKGEKIAAMGATGRASGVHLHFELRKKNHSGRSDSIPSLNYTWGHNAPRNSKS